MTADKLIAQARMNMPLPQPPSIANVERRLRGVLGSLLLGNDYDADANAAVAHLCRAIATILTEIEGLQRPAMRRCLHS
ncbi:MAG: hypothetical protein ACREV7_15725 [Steroidobacteraceae bacterium]